MSSRPPERDRTPVNVDRRALLRGGAALGGAAALMQPAFGVRAQSSATAPVPQPATPPIAKTSGATSLELDVACDGRTFHLNPADPTRKGSGTNAGDSFMVAGSIYPAGTIAKGLRGPDQPGPIGRWICRGAFFMDAGSAPAGIPVSTSSVLFVLGAGLSSRAGDIAQAADGITTEGLEPQQGRVNRVITGGYGKYVGGIGAQEDIVKGTNDTTIMGMRPAPNFTFRFSFTTP